MVGAGLLVVEAAMDKVIVVYAIGFVIGVMAYWFGGRYFWRATSSWHPLTRAIVAGLVWVGMVAVAQSPFPARLAARVHVFLNLDHRHR